MNKFELWQGDCLELMKNIPDGSVDLVLTDPPYGTTACKWDSVIPFEPMWEQLNRIIKQNGAICLFGSEPFSSALRMSNIKSYRYDWIWLKSLGANPLLCKKQPMKYHEIISVFYKKQPTYNPQMTKGKKRNKKPCTWGDKKDEIYGGCLSDFNGIDNVNDVYYPRSYQYFSNANQKEKVHPTQKPIALLAYLIKTYTNEGETVLDFTAGSMSTVIACINTNRNCIAIEKDEHYFSVGCERVHNHILDNNIDEGYFNIAKKRIEESVNDLP